MSKQETLSELQATLDTYQYLIIEAKKRNDPKELELLFRHEQDVRTKVEDLQRQELKNQTSLF